MAAPLVKRLQFGTSLVKGAKRSFFFVASLASIQSFATWQFLQIFSGQNRNKDEFRDFVHSFLVLLAEILKLAPCCGAGERKRKLASYLKNKELLEIHKEQFLFTL